MSEERTPYNTWGGFEIGGEQQKIVAEDGKLYEVKEPPWIKFAAEFRETTLAALRGAPLSVFMCIALHINEEGKSWPSYETIVKETGYKNRNTISEAIKFLTDNDLIEVTHGRGRNQVNTYKIKAYAATGKEQPKKRKSTPAIRFSGEKVQFSEEKGNTSDTGSRTIEVEPLKDYAPNGALHPKPPAKKRKDPEWLPAVRSLEAVFSSVSGIPRPQWENPTRKQYADLGAAWTAPLRDMLAKSGNDPRAASTLIQSVIHQMRKDNLTIADPRSILKTYTSEIGKQATRKVAYVNAADL